MTLYNLRSPGTITKWDTDGNIETQYEVSYEGCTCPAGHRHTCRHRQMLPLLEPIANTHWFLDWDNGQQVVDFQGVSQQAYNNLIGRDFKPAQGAPEPEGPLKQDDSAEGMRCEEDTQGEVEIIPPGRINASGIYAKDVTPTPTPAPALPWRRI